MYPTMPCEKQWHHTSGLSKLIHNKTSLIQFRGLTPTHYIIFVKVTSWSNTFFVEQVNHNEDSVTKATGDILSDSSAKSTGSQGTIQSQECVGDWTHVLMSLASVVQWLLTWSAFDVLTEGLELRLPDSRVFVEDHRAAQPLCGPAQPLRSQLLGVCLKGRKWKGTRI